VRSKKLCRLQFELVDALVSICTSSGQDLGELWHKRMAHLHHGALKVLRESVDGLRAFSSDRHGVCKGCALGKYAKTVFPSSDSRSKGILDLIHSDVCGPMSAVSIGGASYYVTFIDDYSRKTWIYFMKTKDEVFSRFQELKVLMIAASCDILQDMFSSVTELSRPVREPSVGYAHVMVCIVLLCVRVESSPSVGCAHVMGVSFSSV
jgi:hypothetical protein